MDLESGSQSSSSASESSPQKVDGTCMVRVIEIFRILLCCAGYAWAYHYYSQKHFVTAVRWLQVALSHALCGTAVVEGIWFYEAAGRLKGYHQGFDYSVGRNPYQTQNTLWFATSLVISCATFCAYSDLAPPQIAMGGLQLLFFTLSAMNHTYEAVAHGNCHWQNINRPILSLLLLAGALPILSKAFNV